VNERIRAREVRLIDENGTQLGVLPVAQALETARSRELDLIEVAPNATPPVCRIMDYGKYKFTQAKREKDARKRHKAAEMRPIRLRPRINDHDLQTKVRKMRDFLGGGDKVKVNLFFRSREMSHPELGRKVLDRLVKEVEDIAQVENAPRTEGRIMTMILSPKAASAPRSD